VFRSQEMISGMLLTWHNLHYYQDLMAQMREAIAQNTFDTFEQEFHNTRALGDIEPL
jgi:queuine tRNA-ribosyltransferase